MSLSATGMVSWQMQQARSTLPSCPTVPAAALLGGSQLDATMGGWTTLGLRLTRWRLIERLVELAAPAEEQIRYVVNSDPPTIGQSVWDIAGEFWEWTVSFLPPMVQAGVVPPGLATMVERVVEGARAIRDAFDLDWDERQSIWLHTPEAVRPDPLWAEIRHRAQDALEGFPELGLPIPSLTDPDFNAPREDAP